MIEVGETFSSQTFKITDSSGAAGAATVTCSVILPDQTVASPSVTTPAVGDYVFDYLTTQVGRHTYIVTATSGVLGSIVRKFSDVFTVTPSASQGIVSLAEVKLHLNIALTVSRSDTELELMIAAATDKIEERCGPVARRTVTGERHPGGGRAIWLREPAGPGGSPYLTLTSASSVATGIVITPSDIDADPIGRLSYANGSTRFASGDLTFSYVSGRTVTPPGLRVAALNFVKGSWETQRGATGLPWAGVQDQAVDVPGMGLVMWRMEQDMKPFLLPPAVT